MGEAFEADERAGGEQVSQCAAIGQAQILGCQFGQRIEYERTLLNLVVRDFQARLVDQAITEQQDIQIQRTRPPALQALPTLIVFDGLQGIEQVERREITVEGSDRVGVTRLPGSSESL